jgi:CRP/FNR family cyclic AMP-dependent transcriptional regulator
MIIPVETLLAWGASYRKLAPEEMIFREGSEGHFYYQLVSGSVRWVSITDDGREFIQSMIDPGESFGELPLFDDDVYASSAIANKESVVLRLHKNTFRQLLKEEPHFHFAFSRLMAERMRFKFLLLRELACSNPEHRISALFTYFKESKKYICHDCNRVQLTRQQIANMTGLRVETVIRTIKNLQHKGSLVIEKGKVYC